jgi:hypothetical protein
MAATQNVASFEKRLSVSAAGFGGASRTRISSGSRLPSQAPRQRGAVLRHRAAGWGYAPWRRRGCAGLKRKGEPRQPHGHAAPSLRPRRHEHECRKHRQRLDEEIVAEARAEQHRWDRRMDVGRIRRAGHVGCFEREPPKQRE